MNRGGGVAGSRRVGGPLLVALALAVMLLAVGVPAQAANSSPITETTTGPSVVGRALTATYEINATGGPAVAANGSLVGSLSYNATLSGGNISGASVTPANGPILPAGTAVKFTAPNVTESLTLRVEITSKFGTASVFSNFTTSISIVQPFVLSGTLVVGATTVDGFNMTVAVDGRSVGHVTVPTIRAGQSYAFSFDYVPESIAPGWHTMSVSLAPEHGLVTFQGGLSRLSVQFYVMGAPPDYALDFALGIAAFAVAVFIWGSVVGARRRGRRTR